MPDAAYVDMADVAEVIGERGVLHVQTGDGGFAWWSSDEKTRGCYSPDLSIHHRVAGRMTGVLREELGYLCDCIQAGRAPEYVSFSDAVHGVEVSCAIVQSAQSGKEVLL